MNSATIGEAFKALSEDVLSSLRKVGVREFGTPLVLIDVGRGVVYSHFAGTNLASDASWVTPCMRPAKLLLIWRELEAIRSVARALDSALERLEQHQVIAHEEQELGLFIVTCKCPHRSERSAGRVAMKHPLVERQAEVIAAIEADVAAIEATLQEYVAEREELETVAAAYLLARGNTE